MVTDALARDDFRDFNAAVEQLHNQVHVWMGGTLANVDYAAYDPLFWAHHAFIDRLWRLWQLRHPGIGSVDRDLLDQALAPFGMTVRQTLDVASLGYEYAAGADSTGPAAATPQRGVRT